jgi:predicted lipoprotein with Yx(FWY)xxD motif
MKTMNTSKNRRIATLAVGAAAVMALAACGSSSKATVSPGAQPSGWTTAVKGASATPVVSAATTTKLGVVLVDDKGMTLYTLTNNGAAIACTGQCAMNWPPLLVPSGTTSVAAARGITGVATAPGGGGTQLTSDGLPLYRFSGDTAAGDTNGDGLSGFGGVWHVVKAPATAAVAPAATTPTTSAPPTTASSGYGY